MARSAKNVLKAAIRDIEAGKWCKSVLTKRQGFGHTDSLTECVIPGKTDDTMGCAIGLLSLYTDNFGEPFKVTIEGQKIEVYPVKYITGAVKITKPMRESLTALYDALPQTFRSKKRYNEAVEEFRGDGYTENLLDIAAKERAVVMFNDQDGTTQKRALNWFKKALDSLTETVTIKGVTKT